MNRVFSAAIILVLLAACVPASQESTVPAGQRVIITNAPMEHAVFGLPEALGQELEQLPGCCSFELHRSEAVRLHERHRDMFSHRGIISSAALARTLGAGWAVLVSSLDYERSVTEAGELLYIDVSTRVRAQVIDSDGVDFGRFDSGLLHASRVQRASRPLAGLQDEPLLAELAAELIAELAPAVADRLQELTAP